MIVGVNVSKDKFDSSFLKDGKKWSSNSNANSLDGIVIFYKQVPRGQCIYVMEAISSYYLKLAYFLQEKVSVVNRFEQMRFERVKKDKTMWSNKKEALENDPRHSLIAMKGNDQMLNILTEKHAKLEKELNQLIQDNYEAENQLIRSIPGIGSKTVVMLLALTNRFIKFSNYKEFISYIELITRIYDSGTIKRRARICKKEWEGQGSYYIWLHGQQVSIMQVVKTFTSGC